MANNETLLADDRPADILPHHWTKLLGSDLTAEIVRAAGIRSETEAPRASAMLGVPRFSPRCLPALVIPYRDAAGQNGYCRLRPDHPRTSGGKPVKYESPRGRPNEVYIPPGVHPVLPDPQRELLITEGELKALAAVRNGFPCIGLVGVFGWKPKKRETLLAALEQIAWRGRLVYIVFDNDGDGLKPEVADAVSRLAAQLVNRGAVVRVVRLPAGEPGADGKQTKMGLDDFLVSCRARGLDPAGELRALLDAAEDPEPVEGGRAKEPASSCDAVLSASDLLAKTTRDGVPKLRFWRGDWWYWQAGAYREMPASEVRGIVIEHLDKSYYKITTGTTTNVLDALKAKARLSHRVVPPAWIGGDPPEGWRPGDVLVAKNGVIHLPTLTAGGDDYIRFATPRLFTTCAVDYEFRIDAPEPAAWLGFLDQLWGRDPESIETLQDWFGLCLTPDTSFQKVCLLIGPTRCGKGTISRVLRAMIGPENVCGPTLASLGGNFGLEPLLGKSLAVISDARLGHRTDQSIVTERLLSISGEDALTVDRKNRESVTCKLDSRLMILSNELPRLSDGSGALAGRMIILRFTESFYGREDRELTDKLLAELPGILLWAIAGWQRLRERDHLIEPASARQLAGDLADLASPISAFVRDRCIVSPGYRVPTDDLYAAWRRWCEANGRREPGTVQTFGRDLLAAVPGLEGTRPRDGDARYRAYEGIGLVAG